MIANAGELAGRGMGDLRALALRVGGAGLAACDVGRATEDAVRRRRAASEIGGRAYPLADDARVIVVGSGKATLAIAAALERRLGARLDGGAVVVRDGEDTIALERIEVLVADHPLPSERSIAAPGGSPSSPPALRAGDLVLASFTGGSSALTSLPPRA